jgi:hypothetical protein
VIFKADCVNHNSEALQTEICPQAPVFSLARVELSVFRKLGAGDPLFGAAGIYT